MYVIDIIDCIERDAGKNLLGSENFRKKMSSLLITCSSWWPCLYPHLCLFMLLLLLFWGVFTIFCYLLLFSFVCLFLLSSPWTQCRKHNLVPIFVCYHIWSHSFDCCYLFVLLLFVCFIVVTMDAMQEAHSQSPSGQDAAPAFLVSKTYYFTGLRNTTNTNTKLKALFTLPPKFQ